MYAQQVQQQQPARPRKPLTPYFLFLKEYRDTHGIIAASAVEANKIMADKWKALSEDEKSKYTEIAKAEKKQYNEQIQNSKIQNESSKLFILF